MGIFDNNEKLLEAEVNKLRLDLDDAKRSNTLLIKNGRDSAERIARLCKENEKDKLIIATLEQRLVDRKDLPEKNLAAISIFIRGLGVAMLLTSIAFAWYLALGKFEEKSHLLIWILYGFAQFIGMYFLGFGTHTTLRSLSILGSYMSTLAVLSTLGIGLFVMKYVNVLAPDQLLILAGVNGLGIPLLLYVERRRVLTGKLTN